MKKYFILLGILFSTINLIAQTDSIPNSNNDKTVTITVTGQGKTIDDAKTNALRSAIEQAFGTFISSNTTILNDNLVKDEIVSVTNGNIQKYDVLNETPMTDGSYVTTLKATVSVSKLTSFCESKGVVVEFKGGLFTINIKQQILNEQAEIKAIWETLFLLNPIMNQSFDYTLKTSDPKSLDDKNLNWEIPFTVSVSSNKNIDFVFDYLKNSMKNISLTAQEVENYKSLGKNIFKVKLDNDFYYFRKVESQRAIELFFEDLPRITRNFIVEDGLATFQGYWYSKINKLEMSYHPHKTFNHNNPEPNPFVAEDNYDRKLSMEYKSFNLNALIIEYSFTKVYTLDNLDKLTSFKVFSGYSKTKLGTWYNGGRIIYIDTNSVAYISPLIRNEEAYSGISILGFNDENDDNERKIENKISNIGTDTLLGSGYSNTLKLLMDKSTSQENYPAAICKNYSSLGYNDWYLPSKNELEMIFKFHNYFCNEQPWGFHYTPYFFNVYISSSQNVNGSNFYCVRNDKDGNKFVDYFKNNYKVDVVPIRSEKLSNGSYIESFDINKHLGDIKVH